MFQDDYLYGNSLELLHKKYLEEKYAVKDASVLKETSLEVNIDEVVDIKESTRFVITYKGIKWNSLIINPKKKKRLFVILNGSRNIGDTPVFKRWSWAKYMDGAVLNIDDPMCCIYKNLSLGWYYGTEEVDYCQYIVDIVKKVSCDREIIFYASSGGGAAALRCANILSGSTAIVINPQIKLDKFFYANEFEKITNICLEKDELNRNNPCELIKNNTTSKYFIISNIAAPMDREQMSVLLNLYDLKEYRIGLNQLDRNVMLWLYDANAGKPHENQEWLTMYKLIEYLYNQEQQGRVCKELEYLYSLYTDFWFEKYEMQKNINKSKRKIIGINNDIQFDSKQIIYEKEKLIIDNREEDSLFYHVPISCTIKPNTIYCFTYKYMETKGSPIFAIKDNVYEQLIYTSELQENNGKVTFITSSDIDKMEFRIYPSNPPTKHKESSIIRDVKLYEIKI